MHGGDQHHAFLDPTLFDNRVNLRSDMNVFPMIASVKLEVFGKDSHSDDFTEN